MSHYLLRQFLPYFFVLLIEECMYCLLYTTHKHLSYYLFRFSKTKSILICVPGNTSLCMVVFFFF